MSLKIFESRLDEQISISSFLYWFFEIISSIGIIFLLADSKIDSNQLVSILTAASPEHDEETDMEKVNIL